ncbi:MAG: hypothetical protein N3D71_08415 [Burkholderiaceae bacterium]|nr:hypothetical protein [Burkholderiaceae bacterium]
MKTENTNWIRVTLYSALAMVLSGCQALLPTSSSRTPFGWSSYVEAARALEQVVPYKTQRSELHVLGFDSTDNPAVTILNFADIVQRFPAVAALPTNELDPGLRDCLKAGRRCTGYAINVKQVGRKRIGNFWLDTFNFRRESEVTGWSFNALIVLVDDVVVYALSGGQPAIREYETVRNPLGPLQSLGDAIRPPSPF